MKSSHEMTLGVVMAFTAPLVLALLELSSGLHRLGLLPAVVFAVFMLTGSALAYHGMYREIRERKSSVKQMESS